MLLSDRIFHCVEHFIHVEAMLFGGPYFATKAYINVWTPISHGTINVAQIWVVSSPKKYEELNTLEVGWIVSFSHYLYIYIMSKKT